MRQSIKIRVKIDKINKLELQRKSSNFCYTKVGFCVYQGIVECATSVAMDYCVMGVYIIFHDIL